MKCTPTYLGMVKFRAEDRNMSQSELDEEIEKTRERLMSTGGKIYGSFEVYAYLVNYSVLKDIHENTRRTANYFEHEKSHANYSSSGELPVSVVNDLIDIYHKNPGQCFQDKFLSLESYSVLYKDIKSISYYLIQQRIKLSEYCEDYFKEWIKPSN